MAIRGLWFVCPLCGMHVKASRLLEGDAPIPPRVEDVMYRLYVSSGGYKRIRNIKVPVNDAERKFRHLAAEIDALKAAVLRRLNRLLNMWLLRDQTAFHT